MKSSARMSPRATGHTRIPNNTLPVSQYTPSSWLLKGGNWRSHGTAEAHTFLRRRLPSDLMCLLPGGSVPYFIRPVSNSEPGLYNFVGEYWVEGLMYYQRDELSLDDEIKLM